MKKIMILTIFILLISGLVIAGSEEKNKWNDKPYQKEKDCNVPLIEEENGVLILMYEEITEDKANYKYLDTIKKEKTDEKYPKEFNNVTKYKKVKESTLIEIFGENAEIWLEIEERHVPIEDLFLYYNYSDSCGKNDDFIMIKDGNKNVFVSVGDYAKDK